MSNSYITWAKSVSSVKPSDKLVLILIADAVDDGGSWQIGIGDLAKDSGLSRNTVRDALDRIAAEGLLLFRSERYSKGFAAQASHRFQLVRSEEQRTGAIVQGFSADRQILDRSATKPTQNLTEGRSASSPRVGQLSDRHITPQKTPQNAAPARDREKIFEQDCRRMVTPEPIMLAQDFHFIEELLDREGLKPEWSPMRRSN